MKNKNVFPIIISIIVLIFIIGLLIFFMITENGLSINKSKPQKDNISYTNNDEIKQKNIIALAKNYYKQREYDRALTLLDELFIDYGEIEEAMNLQREILGEKQKSEHKSSSSSSEVELLSSKSEEMPFIIRKGGNIESGALSPNEKTTAEKIDSLLNQGINEYNMQNYAKAKSSFFEVLKLDSDNPEANGYLSATLFDENQNDQNNIDEAIRKAKKSLKNDPSLDIAHLTLARIYEKLNSIDLAIAEYKNLLSIKPDNYEVHNSIGKLYYKRGDYENAKNEFQKAITINSDYINGYYNMGVVLQKSGNIDESKEFYKKALSIDQNYLFALTNLANIYFDETNYKDALSLYERGVKISNQGYFFKKIGETYARLGQNDKAIAEFKKSLSKNSLSTDDEKKDAADTYAKMAEVRFIDGKNSEVIEYTTKAMNFYDSNPDIYFFSAMAKAKTGNKDGAIADYKKLISIDNKNILPFISLAKIYYENRDYTNSIEIAKNGLVIDGNNYELLSIVANSYQKEEKYSEAIAWYKKMLSINDINISVYYKIATSYKILNNDSEAIKYFNKTIELDSEHFDSYYELGELFFKKADFGSAKKYLGELLVKSPNYSQKSKIDEMLKIINSSSVTTQTSNKNIDTSSDIENSNG